MGSIDLTVAICMYNAERYIEETLQCLMAQTVQDFHLMIVNGEQGIFWPQNAEYSNTRGFLRKILASMSW